MALSKNFSIFRKAKNDDEQHERHKFIHFIFKAKLFVPFMYFIEKKLKKHMIKKREDIPDKPFNINFKILYDSFEEAYREWLDKFKNIRRAENGQKINFVNKRDHCYLIPNFFIRFALTIFLEDVAYRELSNMFMFRLQANMNNFWNPEIEHKFPMYTWQHDRFLFYFLEWHSISGGGPITININKKSEPKINYPNETRNLLVRRDVYEKIKSLDKINREKFMLGLEKFIMKLDPHEIEILNQFKI